jgi:hypothetical protein
MAFFKADLMFSGMAKSSSLNRNIRLAQKDLLGTNTLAYFVAALRRKSFILSTPRVSDLCISVANFVNILLPVNYSC